MWRASEQDRSRACVGLTTSSELWALSYNLGSFSHLRCAQLMTDETPPGSGTEKVSQEADARHQSTGEGAESAMAVLRDRRDVDRLIVRAELETGCAESPG